MRAGRWTWIALVAVATMLVASTVAAQADTEEVVDRMVERPYTGVMEVFTEGTEFAAEVPFSGETSDFGGLCSEPADVVWRFRWGGLDNVFGPYEGTLFLCVKAEWGVDADGEPAMIGTRNTDFEGTFTLADGSRIDATMNALWEGFDEETGQLTSFVSVATAGGGTGRYAGASLYGTTHCRWVSPEAVMAGVEPELCVMHGMIRYDPFAAAGE